MMRLLIVELGGSVEIFPLFLIQGIPLLLGSLSMVPLGLGVRDASLTFLLTQLGATPDISLTVAMIMRVFVTGFSILFGVVSINYLISKGIFDKNEAKELSNQKLL